MELLFLLLGAHQLLTWRDSTSGVQIARALCLGVGLLLAGLGHERLALPVLILALILCWRDGSLRRTYACWRRTG